MGAAGLVGGAINAAAGGGSLITFPALLSVGIAPLPANTTNTVGLVPGYLTGVLGHARRDPLPEVAERPLLLTAVLGALAGVALLLTTPADYFTAAAPVLVLVSSALLLGQRWLLPRLRAEDGAGGRRRVLAIVFVGSLYGAYFGAALGVLLLALLSVCSRADFPLANAVKTRLSFVVNLVAGLLFAVLAPVHWGFALVLAVTSSAGGYLGGGAARRVPVPVLRGATAALGVATAVSLVR